MEPQEAVWAKEKEIYQRDVQELCSERGEELPLPRVVAVRGLETALVHHDTVSRGRRASKCMRGGVQQPQDIGGALARAQVHARRGGRPTRSRNLHVSRSPYHQPVNASHSSQLNTHRSVLRRWTTFWSTHVIYTQIRNICRMFKL